MDLDLHVAGLDKRLPLASIDLIRSLGEPVQWRFVGRMTEGTRGGADPQVFARRLLGGPLRVQPCARNSGDTLLGPEAFVVGVKWMDSGNVDQLEILAQTTAPDPARPAFLPRRRVHRVRNMLQLAERLSNVARIAERLEQELEAIKFSDREKSSIIQDGISDWLFFAHLMDQFYFRGALTPKWLPLVLVGGACEQGRRTDGHWVLTPGLKAPYQEWGQIGKRRVSLGEDDRWQQIEFSSKQGAALTPLCPSGSLPVVVFRYPRRTFAPRKWSEWRTSDLPLFTQSDDMIWRVEDRLFQIGHEQISWDTKLFTMPSYGELLGPSVPVRLRPWTGIGRVQTSSQRGPWIEVELSGFESKENLAWVRLTTPFSGTDGKKGLHFVPGKGTEVGLGWSGLFDSSVFLVGNARSQETDFPSPSMFLESKYSSQLEDVYVKKVGKVSVESNLTMSIQQQTVVESSRPLRISADGADLKMTSGTVYTGRGL